MTHMNEWVHGWISECTNENKWWADAQMNNWTEKWTNDFTTSSYGIDPPSWPFSEATALIQAHCMQKQTHSVAGADTSLLWETSAGGVGSGCRCIFQLRNSFTGKGNESWGLHPSTLRDGPTMLSSPANNEESNHHRGPSDFCLLSILVFLWKKHFCCFVQFGDSEGSVSKVPFPESLAPWFLFSCLSVLFFFPLVDVNGSHAHRGRAGVSRDLLPISLVFIMARWGHRPPAQAFHAGPVCVRLWVPGDTLRATFPLFVQLEPGSWHCCTKSHFQTHSEITSILSGQGHTGTEGKG